jgi:hypothetical protein
MICLRFWDSPNDPKVLTIFQQLDFDPNNIKDNFTSQSSAQIRIARASQQILHPGAWRSLLRLRRLSRHSQSVSMEFTMSLQKFPEHNQKTINNVSVPGSLSYQQSAMVITVLRKGWYEN